MRRRRSTVVGSRVEVIVKRADIFDVRTKQRHERITATQRMQSGDRIEIVRLRRKAVRLPIVDHLQPVFDGAVTTVCVGEPQCLGTIDPPGVCQRCERGQRRADPQRWIAPAVNELMNLREEFDLANTAAPAFDVEPRAEKLPAMMVANRVRQRTQVANRSEVEAAPPDERLHHGQKALAKCKIPGRGARADERDAFPCQRARFVMRNSRVNWQRDRCCFGRRAQTQIDPKNKAVAVARLQEVDDTARDAYGRFGRLLATTPRQYIGVVQKNRVDIR